MNQILFSLFILIIYLTSCTNSQQNYSGYSGCNETAQSPEFLYSCNGKDESCQAFLILKSQPPYDSVANISTLTSSELADLAKINNVSLSAEFPANKEVIVPVSCSCLGHYYQAKTKFNVSTMYYTYFSIANEAYQGLSTCDSLMRENPYSKNKLQNGMELQVPLRCACPTTNQTETGTKYLLTYPIDYDVDENMNIPDIGDRFHVSTKSILDANSLEESQTLFPSTTVLIPLLTQPSSSQTIIRGNQTVIPPPPNLTKHKSKRRLYAHVGIAAACSLLALISIILLTFFMLYRKRKDGAQLIEIEGKAKQAVILREDIRVEIASFEQVLKVFGFEEIREATENFSSKNRIKGSVYRGDFEGEILAVKRMSLYVSNEVNMLMKISHFNLIRLKGICEHQGCFYFLFENMKNGSLREWLHNKNSKDTGSWTKRIQIALDIANGLHYLHSFTEPAYVHKDIKSSNLLLNGDLRAKIANFSLATVAVKETDAAALTTRVMGTRGYMAPEYVEKGLVTPKIDVYAFGVVLLELITGEDAVIIRDGREILLSAAILSIMQRENAEAELSFFVDARLKSDKGTEYALRVAQLSVACLIKEPEERPSMEEVVSTLLRVQAVLLKSEP